MKPHSRDKSAFTLVELLIVIVIIAILSGMLLPALSHAKNRATTTQCLNNLKQLNICWHMYSGENDDRLGANNSVNVTLGNNTTLLSGLSWALAEPTDAGIKGGYLWPMNESLGIYHCPADRNPQGNTPLPQRIRSYTMSQSVNGFPDYNLWVYTNIPMFRKMSDIRSPNPDKCMVFVDENENTLVDSLFGMPTKKFNGTLSWWSLPSNRHNQAANLSFADGHAAIEKWRVPKVFSEDWIPKGHWQPLNLGEFPDWLKVGSYIKQTD